MSTTCAWSIDDDGVAVVRFDAGDDGLPTLDEATLASAASAFDEIGRHSGVLAVLLTSSAPEAFLAGADVKQLRAHFDGDDAAGAVRRLSVSGQEVLFALERLTPPTVAVIDGVCLGGGLEVALACRYRVATDRPSVRLGLPESLLGLVPGLGGTQRLPRLVGLQRGLTWMLEGRTMNARQARHAGLIDAVLPGGAPEISARRFALRRAEGRTLPRSRPRRSWLRRATEQTPVGRWLLFRSARARVAGRDRDANYPALGAIIDATRAGYATPGPSAYAAEAEAIGRCAATPAARHLVDLFLAKTAAGKPLLEGRGAAPNRVERVAILGAGLMGAGIAHWCASRGLRVLMRDLTANDCARGMATIAATVRRAVRRRHLTRRAGLALLRRISPRTDLRGAERADCVIEAVVEDAGVKRHVLAEAESHAHPDGWLASNTSTIPIGELAEGLKRPERFCGLHFFNPVRRMELVEVIPGPATAPSTLVAAVRFVRERIGRIPLVVQDHPGFLVNRILGPYLAEAAACVEEGAAPEAVDRALERFGMVAGPLRVLDMVGIGTARKAADVLRPVYGHRWAPSQLLDRLPADKPLYGTRRGRRWFRHWVLAPPLAEARAARGLTPRSDLDADEIRERCLTQVVNEAAWALQDGVVPDAAAVDLAMVFATGFAAWTGGPCHWADAEGLRTLVDRMGRLTDRHGPRFTPAPWLLERAERRAGFYA